MESYGNVFDPWEISLCKSLVLQFQHRYAWLKLDFDDLFQQCLIHWYHARTTYTPEKAASPRTYMGQVIKNQLNDILREEMADRRRLAHIAQSLEEMPPEESTEAVGFWPEDTVSLHIDVQRAVGELAPFQQQVCRLLSQGYSIRDIARTLKRSKSTIHREVVEIRRLFSDRGLDRYLD